MNVSDELIKFLDALVFSSFLLLSGCDSQLEHHHKTTCEKSSTSQPSKDDDISEDVADVLLLNQMNKITGGGLTLP